MARFTLKTRHHGEIEFFVNSRSDGGTAYVFIESDGRRMQPCDGGGYRGATLMATPETLPGVARKWWRQRRRAALSE